MPLQKDTIALPITKGMNVQTDARLLDPPALLEAENTQFSGGGAKKRRGHLGVQARGPGDLVLNKVAGVKATGLGSHEIATFRFTLTALNVGTYANTYTLQLVADGTGTGTLEDGTAAVFHYESGVTTVQDLIDAGGAYWVVDDLSADYMLSGVLNHAITVHLSGGVDPATWTFGAGLLSDLVRPVGEEDTLYWSSADPDISELHGVLTRDDETVLWDGFRLWSTLPSEVDAQAPRLAPVDGAAVFPSLVATPLVKQNTRQDFPDYAHNTKTKLLTWVDTEAQVAHYSILDLETNAQIATGTLSAGASLVRVFTLGDWMHIAV